MKPNLIAYRKTWVLPIEYNFGIFVSKKHIEVVDVTCQLDKLAPEYYNFINYFQIPVFYHISIDHCLRIQMGLPNLKVSCKRAWKNKAVQFWIYCHFVPLYILVK